MKINWKVLLIIGCWLPLVAMSAPAETKPVPDPLGQELYDKYPWMLTYYYGITGNNALLSIIAGKFDRWPEYIQSAELAKTLDEDNPVRRFFSPLVGIVQVAGNISLRNGSRQHRIIEFAPYIAWRWANFPWNHYVVTSLAIGEGVSYVSSIPSIEKRQNQNTKRILNYLMLEATFAIPNYPQWHLILRIHHRSGAFGLYHAGNTGSNVLGLGIRYIFE
jgi:hypothetical protein